MERVRGEIGTFCQTGTRQQLVNQPVGDFFCRPFLFCKSPAHITDCHAIAWGVEKMDGCSSLLQMPAALSSMLQSFL